MSIPERAFITEHKKSDIYAQALSSIVFLIITITALYLLASKDAEPIQFAVPFILSTLSVVILLRVLPKQIKLESRGNFFTITHLLTQSTRTYEVSKLDGYRTNEFKSRSGLVKELILIKGNRQLHTLSSVYVTNFEELKELVNDKLKYLGEQESRSKSLF